MFPSACFMFPSACGGSVVSATGEASLQPFDAASPIDSSRPLRSCTSRLSRGEIHHCFPPLAEGQSGRLGRRCYSRLTPHRQTAPNGLSARVPRDSPEERYIIVSLRLLHVSSPRITSDSPEERNMTLGQQLSDHSRVGRFDQGKIAHTKSILQPLMV